MTRPAASEETPCSLCGASDFVVVGRADRDGRPLQTVLCRACGLVFTNPRPSAADMDRYYATEYRTDYQGTAAPPLRKIVRGMLGAQDRRRLVRPLLHESVSPADLSAEASAAAEASARRRVLDVGCGAGEFVYLMRRDGVDASGLEPGHAFADFARRALGIPIQTATVETAAVRPESQDVVTMFHALEHVPDPLGILRTLRGWLKRGGSLVVEVPNVDSTVQAPAHRFHYAHLHHFSGATLGALGEAAGLRLERTEFSDDGGNVTCLFRRGSDEARTPAGLEASAARTRDTLQRHTTARHYLSGTPYMRVFRRLGRRWQEDRLLRRLGTVDAVLVWAEEALKAPAPP